VPLETNRIPTASTRTESLAATLENVADNFLNLIPRRSVAGIAFATGAIPLPARILVVDDDPLSAELICEILRSASIWSLLVPTQGWSLFCKCLKRNGGDDETRTRDLCRDSALFFGNCLKLRGTDGYQNRALEPSVTIIGP
jgi:hypothetical protein